jgi:hypothetical protein
LDKRYRIKNNKRVNKRGKKMKKNKRVRKLEKLGKWCETKTYQIINLRGVRHRCPDLKMKLLPAVCCLLFLFFTYQFLASLPLYAADFLFRPSTDSTTAFQVQEVTFFDIPVLSVDTVNWRVGVGTGTPAEALEVSGSILINGGQIKDYGQLTFRPNADNAGGDDDIKFLDDTDTVIMQIHRNGNVGIGTTDPGAYKLNVNGTGYFADNISLAAGKTVDGKDVSEIVSTPWSISGDIIYYNVDGGLVAMGLDSDFIFDVNTNARLGLYDTNPFIYLISTEEKAGGIEVDSSDIYFGACDPADIIFKTQVDIAELISATGTERMRIENGGNVGIGDSGPDTALEVLNTTAPQLRITHTDGVDDIDIGVDANGDADFQISGDNLVFQNDVDGTTGFQILDADGGTPIFNVDTTNERVGIGDTGPDTALEVLNTTAPQLKITHTDGVDDIDIGVDANGDADFQISGDNLVFQNDVDGTTGFQILDADGGTPIFNVDTTNERVGIGIAAPSNTLSVLSNPTTYIGIETISTDSSKGAGFKMGLAGIAAGANFEHWLFEIRPTAVFGGYDKGWYVLGVNQNGSLATSPLMLSPTGDVRLAYGTSGTNGDVLIGGNVGIGTTTFDGTAAGVVTIANGTAPAAATANQCYIWAEDGDTEATSNLWVMDEAGNKTEISPHDPVTGEWIFYSKNVKTGRVVRVDMERLVKAVEKVTGEQFMMETWEAVN